MDFNALCMVVAFSLNTCELFAIAYKIMIFSDLELDHMNPPDFCKRVNRMVLPETIAQCVITLLLLFSGHWVLFVLNLPFLGYRIQKITQNQHLLAPEKVYDRDSKKEEQKKIIISLIFCVVVFFLYLYALTMALIDAQA